MANAVSLLAINLDATIGALVFSKTNPTPITLPVLYSEDRLDLEVALLKRVGVASTPFYEVQTLTGWALTVAVGTSGTPLAQQATWTANADNTLLRGVLDLNTSGVNALTDGQTVTFEVKFSNETTGTTHRVQVTVSIRKSVLTTGVLAEPAGDAALGRLEAKRTYVLKQGAAGEGIVLTSADGTKQGLLYWDDDGSFRAEPIA